MLAEYLGNDLQKIANQIDKLKILLPQGSEITADIIQKNIGISKEYNPFELNNALGEKNILKANRIINYFGANDRSYPPQFLIPVMYGFFTKLLKYHLLKDKSQANVASELGINPFIVKEYAKYAANYTDKKLVKIFSYLQDADLKSKGVGSSGLENKEILKELVYKILH
jgi:DNA polymerase-3 subunit delta